MPSSNCVAILIYSCVTRKNKYRRAVGLMDFSVLKQRKEAEGGKLITI